MTNERKLSVIFSTLLHIEQLQHEMQGRVARLSSVKTSQKARDDIYNLEIAIKTLSREIDYIRELLRS